MNIKSRRAKKIVIFAALLALLIVPALSLGKVTADMSAFTDVPSNHPFVKTINILKERGLVKGYPNGTFAPDNSVNRAEFITMVIAGIDSNPKGSNCFKDVKDEWFAKYVCSAKTKGLVSGYANKTFNPSGNISFAEAGVILANAYKLQAKKAASGEVWYKPAVKKLEAASAIPTTIDFPEKKMSRAETGEMILRLKDNITGRATKTYAAITAPLPTISSCVELKEKFAAFDYKQSKSRRVYFDDFDEEFDADEEHGEEEAASIPTAMPMATVKMAEESAQADMGVGESTPASDYSSTNVQVEGVDEADVIKNDGGFIYLISKNTVRIVKATPTEKMAEVTKLEFTSDKNFQSSDLYITADKLVIIGSTYTAGGSSYSYYGGSKTEVFIYKMDADRKLSEERTVTFDGTQTSSRRIGNRLYLVMNGYANIQPVLDEKGNVEKKLPQYFDSKTDKSAPIARCGAIRFMPDYNDMNYTIVASVNIEDPTTNISKEMILGAGNTVYSSLTDLYVAGTHYEYPSVGSFDVWMPPTANVKTTFFRFALELDGKVTFKTKGSVIGTILNQFSMDDGGDAFRVVTTTEQIWGKNAKPKTTNLFVLDKNDLNNVLGKIENIAPGEDMHSARFLGKRAYLVTFKQVDPFFVVDLSDNANPKILGYLKIPGYSDYLHPFDENHIIGFGKEVDESIDADKVHNDNAVYYTAIQGMKIALFDVTDVANPKAMFKEVIGDRGTDSEVLTNHRALLYDKTRNLFAFPVTVAEIKDKSPENMNLAGDIVFQGAYVYTLDLDKGFQLKGKITNYNGPDDFKTAGYYWYDDKLSIKRILYIGQNLYTVALGRIKAVNRDSMREVKSVDLEYPEDAFSPGVINPAMFIE